MEAPNGTIGGETNQGDDADHPNDMLECSMRKMMKTSGESPCLFDNVSHSYSLRGRTPCIFQ